MLANERASSRRTRRAIAEGTTRTPSSRARSPSASSQTGEPVIAERASDDERLAKAVSVHQLCIQSIACVPIRGAPRRGRTIGALYLETRLRPGARFHAELPTLAAFADQAAIAIENARLLEENAARTEELARANLELASRARQARRAPRPPDRAARRSRAAT